MAAQAGLLEALDMSFRRASSGKKDVDFPPVRRNGWATIRQSFQDDVRDLQSSIDENAKRMKVLKEEVAALEKTAAGLAKYELELAQIAAAKEEHLQKIKGAIQTKYEYMLAEELVMFSGSEGPLVALMGHSLECAMQGERLVVDPNADISSPSARKRAAMAKTVGVGYDPLSGKVDFLLQGERHAWLKGLTEPIGTWLKVPQAVIDYASGNIVDVASLTQSDQSNRTGSVNPEGRDGSAAANADAKTAAHSNAPTSRPTISTMGAALGAAGKRGLPPLISAGRNHPTPPQTAQTMNTLPAPRIRRQRSRSVEGFEHMLHKSR